ncbi:uncharacterized protein LOC144020083 [Festucalex cinctus]
MLVLAYIVDNKELFQQKTFPSTKSYKNMNKSPSKFSFDKDPLIISIRKDCQLFSYACIDHAFSRNDLYQRSLDLHSQMNQLVHVTRVNRALEKQIDFKTKLVKELQTALDIKDACDAFVRDDVSNAATQTEEATEDMHEDDDHNITGQVNPPEVLARRSKRPRTNSSMEVTLS